MNCDQLEQSRFEYVEGSLSREDAAQLERHLAGCLSCRAVLEQERRLASSLQEKLSQCVGSLALSPKIKCRILAAQARREARPRHPNWLWRLMRAAIPILALGVLSCLGFLLFRSLHMPDLTQRAVVGPITAEISYRIPIYTFEADSERVIDALYFATNQVDQVFWVKKEQTDTRRKMSL
jgi:anti-sigma factor RsiW